jgi:hypothetical protein
MKVLVANDEADAFEGDTRDDRMHSTPRAICRPVGGRLAIANLLCLLWLAPGFGLPRYSACCFRPRVRAA